MEETGGWAGRWMKAGSELMGDFRRNEPAWLQQESRSSEKAAPQPHRELWIARKQRH